MPSRFDDIKNKTKDTTSSWAKIASLNANSIRKKTTEIGAAVAKNANTSFESAHSAASKGIAVAYEISENFKKNKTTEKINSTIPHEPKDTDKQAAEDIQDAMDKLKEKDRIGTAGEILATGGGVAAGASIAGAAAAVAGASTILGSTTLGSALGGVLVATTPVGWVIGGVVVGGAAAYGVSKLIRSGGRNDKIREEIVDRLSKRLDQINNTGPSPSIVELRCNLTEAIQRKKITAEQADRLIDLIDNGKLDINIALERVRNMNTDNC